MFLYGIFSDAEKKLRSVLGEIELKLDKQPSLSDFFPVGSVYPSNSLIARGSRRPTNVGWEERSKKSFVLSWLQSQQDKQQLQQASRTRVVIYSATNSIGLVDRDGPCFFFSSTENGQRSHDKKY